MKEATQKKDMQALRETTHAQTTTEDQGQTEGATQMTNSNNRRSNRSKLTDKNGQKDRKPIS